jgi:hypothetical protein
MPEYRIAVLKTFVFACVVTASMLGGVGDAKAVTFGLADIISDRPANDINGDGSIEVDSEEEEWDINGNGIIESNYEFTAAYYSVNTDKTEYAPGETINLAATALGQLCENTSPYTTLSVTLEGNSETLLDERLVGSQEWYQYGLGTLTAPTTPGTYDILVDACYEASDYITLNLCTQEHITITVGAAPIVPTDPNNPKGVLSDVNCWQAVGWACDPNNYNANVEIYFDVDGVYTDWTTADEDWGSNVVSNACGGTFSHNFYTEFPEAYIQDGNTHTITAYAENIGAGTETQLLGTFTLTCPVKPDIAAVKISPVANAVVRFGSPVQFSGTAINTQSRDFPKSSWAGLEFDIDSDGDRSTYPWDDEYDSADYYFDIPADNVKLPFFAPNETKPMTRTISDLPTGDHEYRFEVDVLDDVDYEQDGYNNYSGWVPFKVIDGDLTVNPTSVASGESGTISWTTENTEDLNCSVVTDTGVVIGTGANGTNVSTGSLSADTTYTLSCESIILGSPTVLDVVGTVGFPDLSVSNVLVESNKPATLYWDTNNGDETLCTLTGGSLTSNPLADDGGDVNTGSEEVVVNGRTTYTLSCPLGSDAVMVEIVPKAFET